MTIIRWKHGTTPTEARAVVQQKLQDAGFADKMTWDGNAFSASVGWGKVLTVKGRIEDQEAVVEQCSGAIGGVVLSKIRDILEQLCPGGEIE